MNTAEQLKESGIQIALDHTPDAWKEAFFECADRLLNEGGSVTSEDVTAYIGQPSGHPSKVGACMNAWVKSQQPGMKVDYEKSLRPSSRSAIIGRWSRSE